MRRKSTRWFADRTGASSGAACDSMPHSSGDRVMNGMHGVLHRVQGPVNPLLTDACVPCKDDCTSCKITGMASRRNGLEEAGRWLRRARERRGYRTAADFARALQVDQSLVSRYERGLSAVGDERAEQI